MFLNAFRWFVSFCKEYGFLILVVGFFVYGTGFLIMLVKGVYENHQALVDLITSRENSAMTFQKACVDDYDSKQKMENNRVKSDFNDKENKMSDESLKIDSRQNLNEIEGDKNECIECKENSEQNDRKLID